MKPLKLIYSRNPQFGKCPDCASLGTLHRSRARSFKESMIKKFTFFKLYRCKSCGWRGYQSTITITRQSLITLIIYLSAAAITAFIVRIIIKKFG